MALLFGSTCGNSFSNTQWLGAEFAQTSSTIWTVSSNDARTGTYSMRQGNNSFRELRKGLLTADKDATLISGAFFKTLSNAADYVITFLSDSDTTRHLSVVAKSTGAIEIRRGATNSWNGTLLHSTGMGIFDPSAWMHLAAKVTLHDTTGAVVVKVNDVQVASISSVDTKNGGTDTKFDSVAWAASRDIVHLDNPYIANTAGADNNDFLSEMELYFLPADSDGNYTDFSLSTGTSHYQLVDEQPAYDEADYVHTSTVTNKDSFGHDNLPAGSYTIVAVIVETVANKDSGTVTMEQFLRISATDYAGTDHTIAAGTTIYKSIYQINPATSAAFLDSAVNSLESGIELTS